MSQMTKQISEELLVLLEDNKTEVRYASLNAILLYTQTKQQKDIFKGTTIFKHLLKNVFTPQMTKLCLSNAINFSSEEDFLKDFKGFAQPLIYNLKQWKGLQEQLTLLFLLNITKDSDIIDEIIGKQEINILLIQILYSLMENTPQRAWLVCNIFANITSVENGRKLMQKQKIYLRFLGYLSNPQERVRVAVLKLIRNMCFLWQEEQFISQLLKQEHEFLDKVAYLIILTIYHSKMVQAEIENVQRLIKRYQKGEQKPKKIQTTTEQISISCLETSIDIILILSNSGFPQRKPPLLQKQLRQILTLLKFTPIAEEVKDKIQALETFCFW